MKLSEVMSNFEEITTCRKSSLIAYRARFNLIVRYLGDLPTDEITLDHFRKLRSQALKDSLSKVTIEYAVSHVSSVCTRMGHPIETGVPLRLDPPDPRIMTLENFDRSLQQMPDWLVYFCAIGYVTGLRFSDIRSLRLTGEETEISLRASKSGKVHRLPLPAWCQRQHVPYKSHGVKTHYEIVERATRAAGVPYYKFQDIRKLSASTWERIQSGFGPLILGHSLPGWSKATPFYLDPHEALFRRVNNFPAPPSLMTEEECSQKKDKRERLLGLIEQLDEKKRSTLLSVAEGLCG